MATRRDERGASEQATEVRGGVMPRVVGALEGVGTLLKLPGTNGLTVAARMEGATR
jgi:hypothetical protein